MVDFSECAQPLILKSYPQVTHRRYMNALTTRGPCIRCRIVTRCSHARGWRRAWPLRPACADCLPTGLAWRLRSVLRSAGSLRACARRPSGGCASWSLRCPGQLVRCNDALGAAASQHHWWESAFRWWNGSIRHVAQLALDPGAVTLPTGRDTVSIHGCDRCGSHHSILPSRASCSSRLK